MEFFFFKRSTVLKKKNPFGRRSGVSPLFFSSFSSASAGVCILFNNNFQFEIIRKFFDQEGRFIIIDMKIDNKILTLVNIYAPNNDNPTFFQNLIDRILSFECEEVIMGGDFNLVMDVQKDKNGGNATTHRNSLKEVQSIANSLDLIDVWRTLNPDGKRFTWRRTKPEVHCRLDYFMISSSLTTAITNADISVTGL